MPLLWGPLLRANWTSASAPAVTSVSCFVRKEDLHLLVLPDGIQDNASFFAEQEEHGDLDVVRVLPITCHLEQRGSVTAAPLVVIWSENKQSSQGTCRCRDTLLLLLLFLLIVRILCSRKMYIIFRSTNFMI